MAEVDGKCLQVPKMLHRSILFLAGRLASATPRLHGCLLITAMDSCRGGCSAAFSALVPQREKLRSKNPGIRAGPVSRGRFSAFIFDVV